MYTAVGDGADGGREDGLEAVGREGCVRQGWNDAVCESSYHTVYDAGTDDAAPHSGVQGLQGVAGAGGGVGHRGMATGGQAPEKPRRELERRGLDSGV